MNEQMYDEGCAACYAYYKSQAYTSLSKHIKPEDAAKLFLPAEEETLMQVSTPMPLARRSWVQGFADTQFQLLKEVNQ